MLEHFIENLLVVYLLEVGAALAGTIYLIRSDNPVRYSRLFAGYLWLVVVVETIGMYPAVNHFTNYSYLPFLEGTVFERNIWLYNIFKIVSFAIYYIFFIAQLQKNKSKKIFKWVLFFFVFSSILNLILTDVFFQRSSAYTFITGTFILLTLIFVYYFELLKSDRILFFYKSLVFYISVGLLLWHVTITPLFIYNKYYTSVSPFASPEFIKLHSIILNISNYFLYSMYIIAFIIFSSNRLDISKNRSKYFKPDKI